MQRSKLGVRMTVTTHVGVEDAATNFASQPRGGRP
jgi:hypothetical protein